ncbi:unnamed protein product [Rhodiola kirilowii]
MKYLRLYHYQGTGNCDEITGSKPNRGRAPGHDQ